MAEAIGVASGVAALGAIAWKSSIALYETINSYQSHQQRVRDLAEETGALAGVLGSLNDTIQTTSDTDLSALEIPLRRCAKACTAFEQEIKKCSSRSRGDHASFRDWARLRYMGDDVDGFRRLLASYKVTISIALTDASLRKSAATAENVEGYSDLLKTAKADLEDRLETIIEKLDDIEQRVTGSAPAAYEIQQIKEEKLSAEKSLQICAQLSAHIEQIQLEATPSSNPNDGSDHSSISDRITREGLEDCKSSLSRMAAKLKSREKELFTRLAQLMSASATSPTDAEAIAGLREEWESTRESMNILSTADSYLGQSTSIIENRAIGDAFQIMVSANGKVLHGTNRADGWRARQFGGYMNDETVQKLSRDMLSSLTTTSIDDKDRERSAKSSQPDSESQRQTEFMERYGKGFKVTNEPKNNP